MKTLDHHDALFGGECLVCCLEFSFAVDALHSEVGAYVFGGAVCTVVGVSGKFFPVYGTGAFSGRGSLTLVSIFLAFIALVSWACREVRASLIDIYEDQGAMFGELVIVLVGGEGSNDGPVEFSHSFTGMDHVSGLRYNFEAGIGIWLVPTS